MRFDMIVIMPVPAQTAFASAIGTVAQIGFIGKRVSKAFDRHTGLLSALSEIVSRGL
jgi:uncharacterized protein with GYD domain